MEASIRVTLYRLNSDKFSFDGDLGPVLINSLLRKAREQGLHVELLAFGDDVDFSVVLTKKKPEVRIVRHRNNLADGNVHSFINRELGDSDAFFTPECLHPLAAELQAVVLRWVEGLAHFRKGLAKPISMADVPSACG